MLGMVSLHMLRIKKTLGKNSKEKYFSFINNTLRQPSLLSLRPVEEVQSTLAKWPAEDCVCCLSPPDPLLFCAHLHCLRLLSSFPSFGRIVSFSAIQVVLNNCMKIDWILVFSALFGQSCKQQTLFGRGRSQHAVGYVVF